MKKSDAAPPFGPRCQRLSSSALVAISQVALIARAVPSRLVFAKPRISLQTALFLALAIVLIRQSAGQSPPTTATSELSPQQRKLIQEGFLHKFGMSKEPSWSRGSSMLPVPDYMWSIYERAQKESLDVDWVRHYYPKELLEMNPGFALSYNLSVSVRNQTIERVRRADIKLKIKGRGRIKIYEIDQVNPKITRLIDTQYNSGHDAASEPQWIDFDVLAAVNRLRPDMDKLDLYVHLDEGVQLVDTLMHSPSSSHLQLHQSAPLVLYVDNVDRPLKHRRFKRSTSEEANQSSTERPRKGRGRRKGRRNHHRRRPHKKTCQRADLHVDFKELHWGDWILSPLAYNAYMCVGDCPNPLPAHLNATNHAIVQSLLNSLNPDVPAPCCVPTELSALNILYRDVDNKIIMKSYPDMKVEACGCR